MKMQVPLLFTALAVLPTAVAAQERAGDAALGALSGAVVLGPVGAVAGAVVGFTAGPSIAHSWGMRRSSGSSRARQVKQVRRAPADAQANASRVPLATGGTASQTAGPKAPPVQGFE